MITLAELAALAERHAPALDLPVKPVHLGDRVVDADAEPVVMGTLNLSRDSTYRDSIATNTDAAIRRGRTMWAQGADLIDIGAESTNGSADRVHLQRQIDLMAPVIEALASDGICVSAETYEPEIARACLEAGAQVLNFTGLEHQDAIYDLAVEYDASVILCSVVGANVREVSDVPLAEDPLPVFAEHFTERLDRAAARGLERIVLDPGLGFFYGNLTVPSVRVDYQTRVILQTFRLRELGLPICHALPHAFDLFQDQFRVAEPMFAVLAKLGGTGVFRTHEVPQVRAVLDALNYLRVR